LRVISGAGRLREHLNAHALGEAVLDEMVDVTAEDVTGSCIPSSPPGSGAVCYSHWHRSLLLIPLRSVPLPLLTQEEMLVAFTSVLYPGS